MIQATLLDFTSPIIGHRSDPNLKFTLTSIFDGYFSFSGTRYQVTDKHQAKAPHSHVKVYCVEKREIKQSLLLNIIKIISYATLIIPIIMALGKFILRLQLFVIVPSPLTNKVQSFQIGGGCLESFPCLHECRIVLSDGQEKTLQMNGLEISQYIQRLGKNKIVGTDCSHFKAYEKSDQLSKDFQLETSLEKIFV